MRRFFGRKRNSQISQPQLRELSLGREPLVAPTFGDFPIAERVGKQKIVNIGGKEAMRKALEEIAKEKLFQKGMEDPIGLINELESRRDGTLGVRPRHLTKLELRALRNAEYNMVILKEEIENTVTPVGLRGMEIKVAQLGQKHHDLTMTEKFKMQLMMEQIKKINKRIGGEEKSYQPSYAASASVRAQPSFGFEDRYLPFETEEPPFDFDGYNEYGEGYNDLGGGRRKKRKTKKRKAKKRKTKKRRKKQKTNKRKKQKTNKKKRRKYKKKSTRKR